MRLLAAILLLALGASHAEAAKPVEAFKQLREWFVACDNLRACMAFGFNDSASDFRTFLRISRAGEPDAQPEIEIFFQFEGVGAHSRLRLTFDDASLGGVPAEPLPVTVVDDETVKAKLPAALVPDFLAAVRKAAKLTVEDLGTPKANEGDDGKATVSMSGATASFLYMDEQQKRVGTVTALAAKGAKPASAVPALPALPVVRVAKPYEGGAPLPKAAPKAVVSAAKKLRAADFDESIEPEPLAARLSASKTLWGVVTEMPAYNYQYALYVVDNGRVRPVVFDDPTGERDKTHEATLPEFDPKTNILKTFYRGRGMGDCGGITEWGWDGEKFRMISTTLMTECRGVRSEQWPVTYRARVEYR